MWNTEEMAISMESSLKYTEQGTMQMSDKERKLRADEEKDHSSNDV